MVRHSFPTKRRRPNLGKSTRKSTVQPQPSYPTYETAAERNWNRISEKQFRYKDEDYTKFPCTVSAEDVRRSLEGTKSTGPGQDGIHYTPQTPPYSDHHILSKEIRNLPEVIYFPDLWKAGLVALLPKPNKDLRDPKNFRSITLLAVLGKVMERIISFRHKLWKE